MLSENEYWPTLEEYLAGEDPNKFWRLSSGDHLNLLEEAILRAERAEEKLADAEQTMIELMPADVLVEGSYIPQSEWPVILGNFMRSSAEHARDAKESFLRAERAEEKLAEVSELHDQLSTAEECAACGRVWPCETRILAATGQVLCECGSGLSRVVCHPAATEEES